MSFELDRTFGIVFIGNPCCEQFFGLCRTAIALDGSIHQFHQTLAHFFNGQRHTQTELTEIFEQRIGPSDTLTFIVRCVRSRRYRTRINRRTARSVRYHFTVAEKLRNQFYIGSFTATRTCTRELEQRSSELRIFHVRFNIYQVLFALHILGTIIPTGSLAQLAFQIGHRQSLTVLIARTNIYAITTAQTVEDIDLHTEVHTLHGSRNFHFESLASLVRRSSQFGFIEDERTDRSMRTNVSTLVTLYTVFTVPNRNESRNTAFFIFSGSGRPSSVFDSRECRNRQIIAGLCIDNLHNIFYKFGSFAFGFFVIG